MGSSEYIDPNYVESELSREDTLLREAFVLEFMKCRNAYKACISLGFMEIYARDWAKMFMGEGIVRRLIAKAEREEDTEEAANERKAKYRAWMETEATYYGPGSAHGSRVSAIAHLMKMEGMETPLQVELENVHKGGVMVVPALQNAEEWSKGAANSQLTLKKTVQE